MRLQRPERAKNISVWLPLTALFLFLAMTTATFAAQTLDTRSFDTRIEPRTDSSGHPNASQEDGWVRVAPAGEEFTVLMPSQPLMTIVDGRAAQDRQIHSYSMNSDGGIFAVMSAPKPNVRNDAEALAVLNPLAGVYEHQFFEDIRKQGGQVRLIGQKDLMLSGYKGRAYQLYLGDTPCAVRIFVTRRKVYTLIWLYVVLGDLPGPPHVDRFLESFTLGPINSGQTISNVRTPETRRMVAAEGAGGAGRVGRGLGRTEGDSTVDGGGGNSSFDGDHTRVFTAREVTQKALITSKPEPQYTAEARRNNVNGTIVLSVVLTADGQVTNIRAVKGLPYGLTERAIESARRVRFTPAVKNGRLVSQHAHLEYNFNLY